MAKPKRKKRPPKKDNSTEITLRQLCVAADAIKRMRKSPDLNPMDAWRLRNLGPALDAAQATQFEIAKSYAENGAGENGRVQIPMAEIENFNKEVEAHLDELSGERVIPIPLTRLSKVGFPPEELLSLEFMILDPEPPVPVEDEE